MKPKVVLARLWRHKSKLQYFTLKQLITTFTDIDFELHIAIDDPSYTDEWTDKIDDLDINITWYDTQFFKDYMKNCYGQEPDIDKTKQLYHVIIGHYLRRVLCYDYMFTHDDDIVYNSDDFSELEDCLINNRSFAVHEPHNQHSDKTQLQNICRIFNQSPQELMGRISENNPKLLGLNSGFLGVNLSIFDEFLSKSGFDTLISLFSFKGIYDENGEEYFGPERTTFDLQEQSFLCLMTQLYSEDFKVLTPEDYYFMALWDSKPDWIEYGFKSKLIHFTGHQKSKHFHPMVDEKLKTLQ